MLESAFCDDPETGFENMTLVAEYYGVPESEMIRTKEDIDNYFLN